jgi:hypothetical protein
MEPSHYDYVPPIVQKKIVADNAPAGVKTEDDD